MTNFIEVEFLGVETSKSGDAIAVRYSIEESTVVHVIDGGYLDTGDALVKHVEKFYATSHVNHVVLTHPDQDHANGLRRVLEQCTVGRLWINRPWLYAEELVDRFSSYTSVEALRRELRRQYDATATLEDIAFEKNIPISEAFQGMKIGAFTVLTPTKKRYLDLVVASTKTPDSVDESVQSGTTFGAYMKMLREAANLVKAAWGKEVFPTAGTSSENEMSIVQFADVEGHRVLLTGDTGRDGLAEAADYAEAIGVVLPGVWAFQVPHHGGRHNVNTNVLDRWLGKRLAAMPSSFAWHAICSSAKADEDHPRRSVIRAMLHRGAHFTATEGRTLRIAYNKTREGWNPIPQVEYPQEQEE